MKKIKTFSKERPTPSVWEYVIPIEVNNKVCFSRKQCNNQNANNYPRMLAHLKKCSGGILESVPVADKLTDLGYSD